MIDPNPFASPVDAAAAAALPEGDPEAERIRRDHIAKEASIKGIASLWLIGGVVSIIFSFTLFRFWGEAQANGRIGIVAGLTLGFLTCGILALAGGILLRRLRRAGRTMVTLSLIINLLVSLSLAGTSQESGQAVGRMIIPILFIITLWQAKANTVFSDHYRLEIIPRTPHVKYRSPRWVWWLLGLLVLFVVIAIVGAVARR